MARKKTNTSTKTWYCIYRLMHRISTRRSRPLWVKLRAHNAPLLYHNGSVSLHKIYASRNVGIVSILAVADVCSFDDRRCMTYCMTVSDRLIAYDAYDVSCGSRGGRERNHKTNYCTSFEARSFLLIGWVYGVYCSTELANNINIVVRGYTCRS